jgi:hypothetical protein
MHLSTPSPQKKHLRLRRQAQLSIMSFATNMQGCQTVYFQTKNPNLGKFWRVSQRKMLVYFITIWSILRPIGMFYGNLVYFVVIWYTFPHFGMLCQEKSGNSANM